MWFLLVSIGICFICPPVGGILAIIAMVCLFNRQDRQRAEENMKSLRERGIEPVYVVRVN
jgi:hypothetical protein